jgi:hypothetical protein
VGGFQRVLAALHLAGAGDDRQLQAVADADGRAVRGLDLDDGVSGLRLGADSRQLFRRVDFRPTGGLRSRTVQVRIDTQGDGPIMVWFRNDLRLADNPALSHAAQSGRPVIPLYILDETKDVRPMGAASLWWLDKSLKALAKAWRPSG